MSEDSQNSNGAAPPAAEPGEPESFTVTRAELDAFAQRAVAEHTKSQPAQTAPSPLDAYWAGMAAKKPSEQRTPAKPGAPSQANSEMSELIALQKMMLMQSLAASAPKPPPPRVALTPDQKLASDNPSVWLRRGDPDEFTADDRAHLVEQHRQKLLAEGFRGHVEIEALNRARRQIVAAGRRALGGLKVTPYSLGGVDLNALLLGRK